MRNAVFSILCSSSHGDGSRPSTQIEGTVYVLYESQHRLERPSSTSLAGAQSPGSSISLSGTNIFLQPWALTHSLLRLPRPSNTTPSILVYIFSDSDALHTSRVVSPITHHPWCNGGPVIVWDLSVRCAFMLPGPPFTTDANIQLD